MKRLLLIALICLGTAQANECDFAIKKHINEAIAHNKKNAKIYSRLSDSESEKLSYTLITLEKLSKLFVHSIEKDAKVYHAHNIPVLCEEVPPMDDLPEFQERVPEEQRPKTFYHYDRKSLSHSLKKLMDEDKFQEAYDLVAKDLYELETVPNQQCLTKHFLESIAYSLKLSETRRAEAAKAGLPDPMPLIKKYISIQRGALFLTAYLDKQAFPLQKDGLLIYCQDVPATNWK